MVFRSLEADRISVVAGARAAFNVPYMWARMSVLPTDLGPDPEGRQISYRTRRRSRSRASGRLDVEVGPEIEPSDLDRFLTSRFGLHTRILGRTWWVPELARAVAVAREPGRSTSRTP